MLDAAEMNGFWGLRQILPRIDHNDIQQAFVDVYQKVGVNMAFHQFDELAGKQKARMFAGDFAAREEWMSQLETIALFETIPAQGAIITTSNRIFVEYVDDALASGIGVVEVAQGLRSRFETLQTWRAWNIARTEVLSAMNYGGEIGAQQTGFDYVKIWEAVMDQRVRDSHGDMHRTSVQKFEKFAVRSNSGYDLMEFPGDPSASPENRVNCRCRLTRRRA